MEQVTKEVSLAATIGIDSSEVLRQEKSFTKQTKDIFALDYDLFKDLLAVELRLKTQPSGRRLIFIF